MNLSTRWKWEEHRISPIVECAQDEGARFLKWEALISEALHSIADCHPPVYPPGKQEDETAKGKKCTKTTIDPQNREEITHEYSPSRVKDQLPLISTSEKKHACKYFGLPFDSAKSWPEPRRGDDHERGPKGRVEWWPRPESNWLRLPLQGSALPLSYRATEEVYGSGIHSSIRRLLSLDLEFRA